MTREELIRLTGLKQVGPAGKEAGAGFLLGFPVKAVPGKQDVTLYFFLETAPDKKQIKAINKRLWEGTDLKGKFGIANAAEDHVKESGTHFSATLKLKGEVPETLYGQALTALETALREEGIAPPSKTCPICSQGEGDALAWYNGQLGLVHMGCLRRWNNERQEALALKEQNAGSLRGILGGLVGGVVGAIPAFLALNFFDYFVWILFALIPLGVYYGWKLLGGRLGKITVVFTIVYSLVMGMAVEVIDTWTILRDVFPAVTLGETISAYLNLIPGVNLSLQGVIGVHVGQELFRELFMRSTLIALGVTAFGIFLAWRLITKTDKHEAADTQAIVDEAIPLEQLAGSR